MVSYSTWSCAVTLLSPLSCEPRKEIFDLFPTRKEEVEIMTIVKLSTSLSDIGRSREFKSVPVFSAWETAMCPSHLQFFTKLTSCAGPSPDQGTDGVFQRTQPRGRVTPACLLTLILSVSSLCWLRVQTPQTDWPPAMPLTGCVTLRNHIVSLYSLYEMEKG